MDIADYPTVALYILLALVTAGTGIGMIVYQTGATQQALLTRRGILAGGVLLILIAGVVLTAQILAIIGASYGDLPSRVT